MTTQRNSVGIVHVGINGDPRVTSVRPGGVEYVRNSVFTVATKFGCFSSCAINARDLFSAVANLSHVFTPLRKEPVASPLGGEISPARMNTKIELRSFRRRELADVTIGAEVANSLVPSLSPRESSLGNTYRGS